MLLHNDKEKLAQLVIDVSNATGVRSPLIEKDYFVTLFLKYLAEKEPLLVFKGGTCLAKCFKIIKRFSEDIDINLDGIEELPQSRKKQLKENIVSVIEGLKLELSNPEQNHRKPYPRERRLAVCRAEKYAARKPYPACAGTAYGHNFGDRRKN